MTIQSVLQAEMILNALGQWVELERGRTLTVENQDGVDAPWAFRVKLLSRHGEEVSCSGASLRDALAQVAQAVMPDDPLMVDEWLRETAESVELRCDNGCAVRSKMPRECVDVTTSGATDKPCPQCGGTMVVA